MPDSLKREVVAALHVEDAGSVAFAAVPPPRQLREGPDGMNRIEVTGDENARLVLPRMGKPRPHAASESVAAGDMFDAGAGDRQVAGREVEHAVDRGGVPCGTFTFDPRPQALQHRFGIERKICRINHTNILLFATQGHRFRTRLQNIDLPSLYNRNL